MRWPSNSAADCWSDFHYYAESRLYTASNVNGIVSRAYNDTGGGLRSSKMSWVWALQGFFEEIFENFDLQIPEKVKN